MIATIPEQEVVVGQLLQVTVAASDSDLPRQTLGFSSGPDAPTDASIDANSGELRWTPAFWFGGAINEFTVVVTDNGQPALSGEKIIKVKVREQNIPPIAGRDFVATVEGRVTYISTRKLLANDYDFNLEDVLSLTITNDHSTKGGSVTLAGSVVTYTPLTSFVGEDEFSYVLSDGRGGTTKGAVDVLVRSQSAQSFNLISLTPLGSGRVSLRMIGKPETSYTVQYSDDLQSWQPLSQVVAGQDGIFEFIDENGGAGQRYYRLTYP